MLTGENFICIATHGWDTLWSRIQPLMVRLAERGNRVLYVDPITSLPTRLVVPEYRAVRAGLRARVSQMAPGLHVLTPPMLLPFASHSNTVCRVNQLFLHRLLRRCQSTLNLSAPILWTYSPYTVHLLGRLGEKLAIYDCTDERTANPMVGQDNIHRLESELVRQVDLVFVTAEGLLARKAPLNPNTVLAPNGVDFDHFARAQSTDLAVPDDIAHIPRPIIGFVGAIAYWVDTELIVSLAEARPHWNVVLVGPVRSGVRVEQLARLPNVYLLGKKHWYSLPAYLRRFDVCISPFRTDQSITATANPLKIYEYLAAGKPIVSSDMPEVRPLRDVIRIAGDTATFIEATGQALEASRRGDSAAVAARMNRARAYDWDALLTGMSAHISHQLTLASGASRVPAARSGALAG